MIEVRWLPTVNAVLNGTSAVLVTAGYVLIRMRKVSAHKVCMLSAVGVSTLFLVSYLYYHFHATALTTFQGAGWVRPAYFGLLISHTVLAAATPLLVLRTAYLGLRGQLPKHVRIARWTLPIWLYVSVTGVAVYVLLYHLYASG